MKTVLGGLAAALLVITLASPANAADDAITLIHGIPDTNVDVEVDGSNVFENFAFGETQDLTALAGQTLVGLKVKLAGTDTVAIDGGDVPLPASGNYSVIAHLDASGTPALAVFQNDTSTAAAGQGRLIVRHAAAAPEVDIKADGAVAFANVANGAEGKVDLPTGTISAEVVPTGADSPVVIGPADLTIAEGQALIVYAVGSLDDETITVLTQTVTGIGPVPSAVNTGNSPIDSGTGFSMTAAALAILGVLALSGFGALALARATRRSS